MKITHYKETPPDPVGEEGASGLTVRWVIAEKDGAPNFSMRVFEVKPGGHSPYHKHPWEHEVFILEGSGCLVQGQEEFPFSRGEHSIKCFPSTSSSLIPSNARKALLVLLIYPLSSDFCY